MYILVFMKPDEFAAIIAGLEAQGISQTEIARETGLSRMTIWRLTVGETPRPSYDTVQRLKTFQQRVTPHVTDMLHR